MYTLIKNLKSITKTWSIIRYSLLKLNMNCSYFKCKSTNANNILKLYAFCMHFNWGYFIIRIIIVFEFYTNVNRQVFKYIMCSQIILQYKFTKYSCNNNCMVDKWSLFYYTICILVFYIYYSILHSNIWAETGNFF